MAATQEGDEETEAVKIEPSVEPITELCADPIVILVKDLELLRLILTKEEHWKCKCKISIRSRFKNICNHIKENLNDEELKRFKETQFGHLLDVPDPCQYSSQLL